MTTLLHVTDAGLYCPAGNFHIDPWGPADRALITHAHSDHARWGCTQYLTASAGEPLLRARMGSGAVIENIAYGEPLVLDGTRVSFHPAGHILGSAQIRIEHAGEVWVVSGDYKIEPDATCAAFEPIRCHTFVSESTFGLPIYRWTEQAQVQAEINAWWRTNQEAGKASVLFAYALGKAQRVLSGLDPTLGPIFAHGAVERFNAVYRASGVPLPETRHAGEVGSGVDWSRAMILAPPSCNGTPWMRRFGPVATGFASGWMQIRGTRRRRSLDRGFVLSDHADWPGLMSVIDATGAERIWVTHGYRSAVVRWLQEKGLQAQSLDTRFESERDEGAGAEDPETAA